MLARIRKALVAGVGAGASAAIGILATGGLNDTGVQQAVGAFIVAAAVTGYATFTVKNAKPESSFSRN